MEPLSPIYEEPALLTCRLCHEILKDAKTLPCSHKFCRECLDNDCQSKGQESEYICPVCKSEGTVSTDNIAGLLSHNPHILGVERLCEGECKLCLSNNPAAEYCVDCALPLCSNCLRKHATVPESWNHSVISVKRVGKLLDDTEQTTANATANVTQLSTIPDKVDTDKSVRDLRTSLQQYRTSIQTLTKDSNTYLASLTVASKHAEAAVCVQAEKLHKQIDEKKEKLVKTIKDNIENEEASIKQQVTAMAKTEQHMVNTADFLEHVTKDASEAFAGTFKDKIYSSLKTIFPMKLHSGSTKISSPNLKPENGVLPKPINREQPPSSMKKREKALLDIDSQNKIQNPRRSILRSNSRFFIEKFRIDESLTAMTCTVDGTIAVTTYSSQKCTIYSESGLAICEINKGLVRPISVLSLASGKLLIADLGDESRKMGYRMYYTDGELFPTHLSISEAAWGMAETVDGDLVVCHPESCKVCIYDRKGRTKVNLKVLNERELFRNPRCVCVSCLGDIIVSDFEQHRVSFFDSNGHFKYSYGSEGQGTRHLHHPCGVTSDSSGNVIIADSENHRISLISPEGKFIKFLFTEKDGLKDPVAVCFNKDDNMIIGEWSGRIIVVNYDSILAL